MFSIFKSKGKKKNGCPEGSVHAWEYEGVLYKTKGDMEEAKKKAKMRDLKSALKKELFNNKYRNTKYRDEAEIALAPYPLLWEDRERMVRKETEVLLEKNKGYSSEDLIDILVERWDDISTAMRFAKEIVDEKRIYK